MCIIHKRYSKGYIFDYLRIIEKKFEEWKHITFKRQKAIIGIDSLILTYMFIGLIYSYKRNPDWLILYVKLGVVGVSRRNLLYMLE